MRISGWGLVLGWMSVVLLLGPVAARSEPPAGPSQEAPMVVDAGAAPALPDSALAGQRAATEAFSAANAL